jgi:hypothetical protein
MIWGASVALLCAPLLTSAYAAPAPHQQQDIQRRYRVPVRRAPSAGVVSNEAPAAVSIEAAPSVVAAPSVEAAPAKSDVPEAAPSQAASIQVVNIPASEAPPAVSIAAVTEPSALPKAESQPQAQEAAPSSQAPAPVAPSSEAPAPAALPSVEVPVVVAAPSSEIVPPTLPSSEIPPPSIPSSEAAPLPSASAVEAAQPSSGGLNLGAIISEAVPSNLFVSVELPSAIIPSIVLPSNVAPVVESIAGLLLSATLPSVALPSVALPSVALPTVAVASEVAPLISTPSDILSSIVGGVNGLISSIALPSVALPSDVPSVDLPASAVPSISLAAPSLLPSDIPSASLAAPSLLPSDAPALSLNLDPSSIVAAIPAAVSAALDPLIESNPAPVSASATPVAESSAIVAPILSDPAPSAPVSQIIVGLNTIISDLLPSASVVPADPLGVNSLGGALSSIIDSLPSASLDPIGVVESILSALPLPSDLPSDIGGAVSSIVGALPTGDLGGAVSSIIGALPTGDLGGAVSSLIDSLPSALPSGGIIAPPDPTASAVLPSDIGGILPSALPASAGVSQLLPLPSGIFSDQPPAASGLPPSPSVVVTPPGEVANGTDTKPEGPTIAPVPTNSNQFTVAAIGSDAATVLATATGIVLAPTDAPKSSTVPSSLPKVIQPPGGKVSQQANTTLIQIGFLEPLNYQFVSATEEAINQIFQFMPMAVTYGIDSTDVQMQSIQPYDTLKNLKYMTTLAMLYVPSGSVAQLSASLHNPSSALYLNPDDRVKTLMTFINPAIPLLAGQALDVSAANAASTSYTPGSTNGADPFGPDAQSNPGVNTSSAAIATPLAVGAVVYGCAMIFVARRYKQRRQAHRRASSISGEPAWMTEARAYNNASAGSRSSGGHSSARTQQISAPLTSSNSLGW